MPMAVELIETAEDAFGCVQMLQIDQIWSQLAERAKLTVARNLLTPTG